MRYDKDIVRKKEGDIRIVSLGDSISFGYRIPITFPNDPLGYNPSHRHFAEIIQERFSTNNPDYNIEVIPMAVPGYTTYQGYKWLERDIDLLDPDLIIILFGWNDTELHDKSDKEAFVDNWLKLTQRNLISSSQALIYSNNWFKQRKKISQSDQGSHKLRVSKEEYIDNILAINELAKDHGAKVITIGPILRDLISNVAQGDLIVSYRSALAQAAKDRSIPYLEIKQLTEQGYPENDDFFGELVHPNHIGHELMADMLLNFINDKKLLENLVIEL